jgi:hypothetical protein
MKRPQLAARDRMDRGEPFFARATWSWPWAKSTLSQRSATTSAALAVGVERRDLAQPRLGLAVP